MNSQIATFLDLVRQETQKYSTLKKYSELWEEKTGINFEYLLCSMALILVFMLFSGIGANFICHSVAFLYPTYASLIVLHAPEKGPLSQFWLVYWVVYAFIGVVESIFFFLKFLPLYFVGKLIFLLWLYLPVSRGADKIYTVLLSPLFKEHEDKIDNLLRKVDSNIVKEKRK